MRLAIWQIFTTKVNPIIGLHDLYLRNLAFGAKLGWKMYTNIDSLWLCIMRDKYLDSNNDTHIFMIANPPPRSAM